jgi:uncharacterized protein with HEPN domain
MTPDPTQLVRLRALATIVTKECRHLASTDQRLFGQTFTRERAERLEHDPDLAERVEAFVGRYGRLQDTLGDKLLPRLLASLGEPTGAAIDNLDRAERLGFIPSSDEWQAMRRLRNQMVHEYVEDLAMLASALESGHTYTRTLLDVAATMLGEIDKRGWMEAQGT